MRYGILEKGWIASRSEGRRIEIACGDSGRHQQGTGGSSCRPSPARRRALQQQQQPNSPSSLFSPPDAYWHQRLVPVQLSRPLLSDHQPSQASLRTLPPFSPKSPPLRRSWKPATQSLLQHAEPGPIHYAVTKTGSNGFAKSHREASRWR